MTSVGAMRRLAVVGVLLLGAGAATAADYARPGEAAGPTEVRVAISVLDLTGINDTAQTITANVFIRARWQDPRLAEDGAGPRTRGLAEAWHPRLQVFNDAGTRATLPNEVEISPDGTVTQRIRLVGAFSEVLHLEDFPFDRQIFSIRLVATGYTAETVRLVADAEGFAAVNDQWAVSNWTLLGWDVGPASALVPAGGQAAEPASLALNLHMKRNIGYFLFKVLLPLVLISAMSWVVFWVAPEQAATKISVSITSMLTLIANRFMVDALVPRVSYLTRLDLFILGATVLVFANLVLAVAASVLAARKEPERARAIDERCRVALPVIFTAWAVWSLAL
ncbi:MAG: hypothetical protein IAE82_11405 [Opitutaceae bacterium]|nr:hypothetical protein [Opitutaceae bacterium]